MPLFDLIAEQRIAEAVSRGEFDDEIRQLEDLVLGGTLDAHAHSRAVRKLALLRTRIEGRYYEKAVARLAR